MNIYTAKHLFTNLPATSVGEMYNITGSRSDNLVHTNANYLITDMSMNWATALNSSAVVRVYKFFPNDASTYTYYATCGNRGICNTYDGVCDCFPGYGGDACYGVEVLNV